MGGRRPLRRGAPRLLGRHDGAQGRAYALAYAELEADLGPFPTRLLRFEAGRVALARLNLVAASVTLAAARRKRDTGRGRRPDLRLIERLSRRQALQDQSYGQAVDRLRDLVTANGHRPDLASQFAEHHREAGGA
jgi:hypothetical protein